MALLFVFSLYRERFDRLYGSVSRQQLCMRLNPSPARPRHTCDGGRGGGGEGEGESVLQPA